MHVYLHSYKVKGWRSQVNAANGSHTNYLPLLNIAYIISHATTIASVVTRPDVKVKTSQRVNAILKLSYIVSAVGVSHLLVLSSFIITGRSVGRSHADYVRDGTRWRWHHNVVYCTGLSIVSRGWIAGMRSQNGIISAFKSSHNVMLHGWCWYRMFCNRMISMFSVVLLHVHSLRRCRVAWSQLLLSALMSCLCKDHHVKIQMWYKNCVF